MIHRALYSSRSEEWETPQPLFDKLNGIYQFTLDPAATDGNRKCVKYFTRKEDGLHQSWAHERVFLNPPQGRDIGWWMHKCSLEYRYADLIVALVPVRAGSAWWHESVIPHAYEIAFLRGAIGGTQRCLVIYRPDRNEFNAPICTAMGRP